MRALKLASNPSKVAPSGVRPEAQGQLGRSIGLDLQARLIAKGLRIPTIFVTAFPDATTRARAMNAGALCYLTKPFNDEELLNYLRITVPDSSDGTDEGPKAPKSN
jgi:FixJ family two-component response regulator